MKEEYREPDFISEEEYEALKNARRKEEKDSRNSYLSIIATLLLMGGSFFMKYNQNIGIGCAIIGGLMVIYLLPYIFRCLKQADAETKARKEREKERKRRY